MIMCQVFPQETLLMALVSNRRSKTPKYFTYCYSKLQYNL